MDRVALRKHASTRAFWYSVLRDSACGAVLPCWRSHDLACAAWLRAAACQAAAGLERIAVPRALLAADDGRRCGELRRSRPAHSRHCRGGAEGAAAPLAPCGCAHSCAALRRAAIVGIDTIEPRRHRTHARRLRQRHDAFGFVFSRGDAVLLPPPSSHAPIAEWTLSERDSTQPTLWAVRRSPAARCNPT
jgi:hypothetical protein